MEWYYMDNERKVGPVTEKDMEELAKQGKVTSESKVWNEVASRWMPYIEAMSGSVGNTSFIPETEDTVKDSVCIECGRTFSVDEMIEYGEFKVCASCKPAFFQKMKEGASTGVMEYAGFWIRFGAKFIDGIIMTLFMTLFMIGFYFAGGLTLSAIGAGQNVLTPAMYILIIFQYAFPLAYTTFFLGKFAATPGKMACGLKVLRADGESVSYWRAAGRHLAEFVSSLTLMIGYLMAAFDSEKRALHDRMCNTRVIKK